MYSYTIQDSQRNKGFTSQRLVSDRVIREEVGLREESIYALIREGLYF